MTDGFLLCGHGSRDPASTAGFAAIARGLAPLLPPGPFAHGFMELAAPDIGAAMGRLVAAGATRVLAVPGFLGAARHLREDLPRELAVAGAHHAVPWVLGRELGPEAALIEALGDRLSQAVDPGQARLSQTDGVILVAAGSSDEAANTVVTDLAAEIGRRRGVTAVAAFASVARPAVGEAAALLLAEGAGRIVLLPWFLTEGRLLAQARSQARAAVAGRAEPIEAAVLGDHPLVLATLAVRAGELTRAR